MLQYLKKFTMGSNNEISLRFDLNIFQNLQQTTNRSEKI